MGATNNAGIYIRNTMIREIGFILFSHYPKNVIDDLDWEVFDLLASIVNGLDVTRVDYKIKERLLYIMLELNMLDTVFYHEVDKNWIGEK